MARRFIWHPSNLEMDELGRLCLSDAFWKIEEYHRELNILKMLIFANAEKLTLNEFTSA